MKAVNLFGIGAINKAIAIQCLGAGIEAVNPDLASRLSPGASGGRPRCGGGTVGVV